MKRIVLLFALLCATAWSQDRAVIVDPPVTAPATTVTTTTQPAPKADVVQPPPQVVRIEVVQPPAAQTTATTTTTGPIVAPVQPPVVTAQQIESAVEVAVSKFKAAQAADPNQAWWKDLIQALIAGALSLGTVAIAWISKKIHDVVEASKLAQADKDAVEALNAGVTSAEQSLYDDFAARSADGSIDAADAVALRQHALDVAKDVAKGPGLAALKAMALPRITDLIERILLQRKVAKAQADPGVTVTAPANTPTTTTVQTTPPPPPATA